MSICSIRIRSITPAVVLVLLSASSFAHAAQVIWGGPTYDASTGVGYNNPILPYGPGSTAGNGAAVGSANRYKSSDSIGSRRAVRWDASGTAAIELGNLGLSNAGNTTSVAFAINAVGTAVGFANKYESGSNMGNRAVRWDASGTTATELGHLGLDSNGSTTSQAYAINAVGTAVGYARKYEAGNIKGGRAVRWDASGTVATELGHIGIDSNGSTSSYAYAINAAGTAVGYATKFESGSGKGVRAVRWDASGTTATELGHLGLGSNGSTTSYAYAINAAGTAVGYANKYESGSVKGERAVRWDASGNTATELGHLGLGSNGSTTSYAYAINAAGTAVGYANKYESGGGERAVRWDASGAATELGNLAPAPNGYTLSRAYAINAAGIAVGNTTRYDLGGKSRAIAWGLDGVAIDLNTLLGPDDDAGWTSLYQAIGISDTYWITGYGIFYPGGPQTGYLRLFLLDAVSLFGTPGDATRDGLVNFDDLLLLAQHYGTTAGGKWDTGDFNSDGAVGFDDLLALAQRYGHNGSSLAGAAGTGLADDFQADWALAQSLVPEPASLSLLALAGLAMRRRHRLS